MEKIESIVGKFGQISWPLFKKSCIYVLIFGLVAFLRDFVSQLPSDFFSINLEILKNASMVGVNSVWEEILLVITPLLISIVNPIKK